jgi:hypothetical protein
MHLILDTVAPSVITMSVANKPLMLSVGLLIVVMLNVIMMSVVVP